MKQMPRKNKTKKFPQEGSLFQEWASHICLECGRCCIQSPIPVLNDEEAKRLWNINPTHTFEEFKKEHLCEVDWDSSEDIPEEQVFKGSDGKKPRYLMMGRDGRCPFLKGENNQYKCSAYDVRPEACRTFDCKPLMWFRRYFLTGVLTYTVRPETQREACRTILECIADTNAMMSPPDSGEILDPRRFIKEKTFAPAIDNWNSEQPKDRKLRKTRYTHELPRHDGEND